MEKPSIIRFKSNNKCIPIAFNNADVNRLDKICIGRTRSLFIRNVVLDALNDAEAGRRDVEGIKIIALKNMEE